MSNLTRGIQGTWKGQVIVDRPSRNRALFWGLRFEILKKNLKIPQIWAEIGNFPPTLEMEFSDCGKITNANIQQSKLKKNV